MKLRNKKTGEIIELPDGFFCGDNLKKICEEWEDYEEPKGIQCIYYVNHFDAAKIDGVIIGFGTKEEAEKPVEKSAPKPGMMDEVTADKILDAIEKVTPAPKKKTTRKKKTAKKKADK